MTYEMDMNDEHAPKKKVLIPEGWRGTKITNAVEKVSKAGNEMILFTFLDVETKKEYEVHAVSVPKKRWLLKQILSACSIAADENGIYKWDLPDVIGQAIDVLIEHEPNEYIDREGKTQKGVQHRVSEVRVTEIVSWDN